MSTPDDAPDLPAAAVAALREGQTIKAIRIVREARGLGLKEAKDAVDAAIAGDPALRAIGAMSSGGLVSLVLSLFGRGEASAEPAQPAAQPRSKFGGLPDPGASEAPAEEFPPEALAALDRDEMIEAIKIIRMQRGLGLAEAKALVDAELARRARPG